MGGRTIVVIAGCIALLATTVWAAGRDPEPPPSHWPAPEELDSLSRYLVAGEAAPRLDDYAVFLPAADAPVRWNPPAATEPEPMADLRLTAILITGGRPLAIVNDRHVRPGQAVDGGAVVVSIARDHVVVRERNGMLRTLRLPTGTE